MNRDQMTTSERKSLEEQVMDLIDFTGVPHPDILRTNLRTLFELQKQRAEKQRMNTSQGSARGMFHPSDLMQRGREVDIYLAAEGHSMRAAFLEFGVKDGTTVAVVQYRNEELALVPLDSINPVLKQMIGK